MLIECSVKVAPRTYRNWRTHRYPLSQRTIIDARVTNVLPDIDSTAEDSTGEGKSTVCLPRRATRSRPRG